MKSKRHQMAAHVLHSRYDSRDLTRNGTAASPASLDWFERKVDPGGTLDPAERARRAEHARKAHFMRLGQASARKRKAS